MIFLNKQNGDFEPQKDYGMMLRKEAEVYEERIQQMEFGLKASGFFHYISYHARMKDVFSRLNLSTRQVEKYTQLII